MMNYELEGVSPVGCALPVATVSAAATFSAGASGAGFGGSFAASKRVGFFAMNSHANALYDSAPLERGSRNTTGVPIDGASETRTLRGISVS